MKSKIPIWIVTLLVIFIATGRTSAQDCYQSSILSPSPFMGNSDEIFKLADGSVWQVTHEYKYLYAYYPSVIICPGIGKLIVGGKPLNVQLVGAKRKVTPPPGQPPQTEQWEMFEETNLQGTISGVVQQGRIFKTISGNVYEVAGLTIQVVVQVQPEVMVLRNGEMYKLIVTGFEEPLLCRKLN